MTVLTMEQRLGRLEVRLAELTYWSDRASLDLDGWTFNGEPLAPGQVWPSREGVVTLAHPEVSVPAAWPLEDTRLDLDLGGEALLRLRYHDGSEEAFGLDPYHQRFPLRERTFSLEAPAVARLPFGVPSPAPTVRRARLIQTEPALIRLLRQCSLIMAAARALAAQEVAQPLLACAERALALSDWPSATPAYLARTAESSLMRQLWTMPEGLDPHPEGLTEDQRATVVAAAGRLERDLLELRRRYPPEGALAVSGQAHLDLAWLWPLEETRRKARRTFHTMVGLMDRYPEFTFLQTSAQLYAWLEQDDPGLLARIREKAGVGQWEPVGGMWVECDLNMPAGESLVRQLLYGQRYFRQQLGSAHTVCWLPDTFGFSPALPQLLRGAGIEHFFTTKLYWSETNRFPYDFFWWEGLDGSRVLAHLFDNPGTGQPGLGGYNGDPEPRTTVDTWRNYRAKHLYPEGLLTIGYGDGGGGTTPDMLEQIRELAAFPALPSLRFARVRDFFDRARAAVEGEQLPVWVGELYLELHRGTLTTQGRTKYLHRRAERDLIAAEVTGSMNALLGGDDPASLESHWRVLLHNQFHDILPGSGIREVYQTAEAELASVGAEARTIAARSLSALAERVTGGPPRPLGAEGVCNTPLRGDRPALLLVNPDLSPRPVRLQLDGDLPGAQPVEGGSVLTTAQLVPGLGAIVLLLGDSPGGELSVSPYQLENALVRVSLADDGTLAGVYDKRAGREVLAGRGNQLWAYVDKPRDWDAWEIDAGYAALGEELAPLVGADSSRAGTTVLEAGPYRAAIRLERRFRHSRIVQDIRLWANSARLEFKTTLDWHDRHWLLQARFPLAVRSQRARFETAFGVVERPTYRNTSWDAAKFEVAGHRFADLSEPGYGVALLNDGKYGYHALDNELGLSLLRSPTYPDPLADEGIQTFTYALYPHQGDWLQGGVLMEAEDLNRPLLAHPCRAERETSWQALRIEGLQLGLGALKALEDGGGLVLRAYEPHGARGTVRVEPPPGWTLESELDLLEGSTGPPDLSFTPFQVHSWLLKRKDVQ